MLRQLKLVRFNLSRKIDAEEVREQEAELGFKFDYIVVCVVTGSTQGGMIVGFKVDSRANKVIGIDASGTLDQTRAQVKEIAQKTATLIELGQEITDNQRAWINPRREHVW